MQRVKDFSELFRLKQSRQKTQSKASHEKRQFWRIYSPVYLQTNPRHRPEENEEEEEDPDRKPYTRFPRTPGGRSLGSKIWMS